MAAMLSMASAGIGDSGGGDEESARPRTADVSGAADSFAKLLLPRRLSMALVSAGFRSPSPVQEAAIPLARLGCDLIVQAKSGTGKTLVYALSIVERLDLARPSPQAIVIVPTREIALQVRVEIDRLAAGMPTGVEGIRSAAFIGGVGLAEDRRRLRRSCHVAVGTPGRLKFLVCCGEMRADAVRVAVIDEADRLVSDAGLRAETEAVLDGIPQSGVQLMAFSATYGAESVARIESRMKRPQRVMISPESTALVGVRHCYKLVRKPSGSRQTSVIDGTDGAAAAAAAADKEDDAFERKVEVLLGVLNSISFHQAIVFTNSKGKGEGLAGRLTRGGMPAAFICGGQPQEERMKTMDAVRGFELRVVVSTDLVARGVDLERVNMVCCMDLPTDAATYMHRIGRTGRFGTYGVCVAFVEEHELAALKSLVKVGAGRDVEPLPDKVPDEWYAYKLESKEEENAYAKLLQAPTVPEPLRHFQDEPEHWMDGAEHETLEWWRDWMGKRDSIWDKWDPYVSVGQCSNNADHEPGLSELTPNVNNASNSNSRTSGHPHTSALDKTNSHEFGGLHYHQSSFLSLDSIVYSEECFPVGQDVWNRERDGHELDEDGELGSEESCDRSNLYNADEAKSGGGSSCSEQQELVAQDHSGVVDCLGNKEDDLQETSVQETTLATEMKIQVSSGSQASEESTLTAEDLVAEDKHSSKQMDHKVADAKDNSQVTYESRGTQTDVQPFNLGLGPIPGMDVSSLQAHWVQAYCWWHTSQSEYLKWYQTACADWHTRYKRWCQDHGYFDQGQGEH